MTCGINVQQWFVFSLQRLPHLASAAPPVPSAFELFLSPGMMSPTQWNPTDITQPDKTGECAQFTSIFFSHPVALNQALAQWHYCAANCWQWLDIMHRGTVEKPGCRQPVFLFYWNIRLSWQKWMLPGITNEPINQWISWAAIKLMWAGWASSSRGCILGTVINTQNRQRSTILLLSWTMLPELFSFQLNMEQRNSFYFMCFPLWLPLHC